MGNLSLDLIKPSVGVMCKFGSRWCFGFLVLLLAGAADASHGVWETWSSESFTLEPREAFQLRVAYDEIQVRSWKLVVDGGDQNCDVLVTRWRDGSLLYQLRDQRHHEVEVPWGVGEEVSVVITNRRVKGAFVVSVLGPPRDEVHASYSYHVNRALEKFAAGRRLAAADQCRLALLADPDDGVAKVLQAGFFRDRHEFAAGVAVIDEALAGELPGEMRSVALSLRVELQKLQAPLPESVRESVVAAERFLTRGKAEAALARCDDLVAGNEALDAAVLRRVLMIRGRALVLMGQNFSALDVFTQALQLSTTRADEGVVYYHMGQLYLEMENLPQARGAFAVALQAGLPSGLEMAAREALKSVDSRLRDSR